MDVSNRIESEVPLLAIPDHLVFAFEEWIAELIREGCDSVDSPQAQEAVIKAVHIRDGFVAGSLTPIQISAVADGAADWLQPHWPTDPKGAGEVERLAAVTRELKISARVRPQRCRSSCSPTAPPPSGQPVAQRHLDVLEGAKPPRRQHAIAGQLLGKGVLGGAVQATPSVHHDDHLLGPQQPLRDTERAQCIVGDQPRRYE